MEKSLHEPEQESFTKKTPTGLFPPKGIPPGEGMPVAEPCRGHTQDCVKESGPTLR